MKGPSGSWLALMREFRYEIEALNPAQGIATPRSARARGRYERVMEEAP
jgi:hypothetical protein